MSELGELSRQVARLVMWLRVFAAILVLCALAPVQAVVFSPARFAVAGGLICVVAAVTTLVRRGHLLPERAYGVAGVAVAVAAGCALFIAPPSGNASGSQLELALVALVLAFPAGRMIRRYTRRCAASEVSSARAMEAARIPPLSGVRRLRRSRVHLGVWTPVLLIIQLANSAVLLCLAGFSALAVPPFIPSPFDRPFGFVYARVRHDLHDRIGRSGAYRTRSQLALFVSQSEHHAKIKVRSDAMRWGTFLPHTVRFVDYLVEQLQLYGVPCLVRGASTRAWAPPEAWSDIAGFDAGASPCLVLLVAAGTRGPTPNELDAYAPRALFVLPPGEDVAEVRRELARIAPRVATRLLPVSDKWLRHALAVTVESSGAINLHVAKTKSQWMYMAAFDDAARRLGLEYVTDVTGISHDVQDVPLAVSLGVSSDSSNHVPELESGAGASKWSFEALAAIVLGVWGIGVISANRPRASGSHHGDLILGIVMAGLALGNGMWAAIDTLKDRRVIKGVLALLGLIAGCVSTVLAVQVLTG